MNIWKWITAVFITALLLTMNIMLFDRKKSTAIEAPRLETTLSKEHDFIKKWEVTGFAQSKNTFDIHHDPSLGRIKEILVEQGETVTSGQTLVTHQNEQIEKELRSLKREKEAADVRADHFSSQVSEWESELSDFDEEEDAAQTKVMLQEKLADAELQADLADKESSVLFDEILELEKKLDALSIKSPADGVVSEINLNDFDQPVVKIMGLGNYEINATVSGNIASIVKTGDSVQVSTPKSKKKLNGTVQTILPAKKEQTFIISVLVEDEFAWAEGQKATLFISETLSAKAVSVPNKAVIKDDGKEYVYTIVKDKLYKMNVSTGLGQDGAIEIKKGLKKGQNIVLSPSEAFVSGEPAFNLNKK